MKEYASKIGAKECEEEDELVLILRDGFFHFSSGFVNSFLVEKMETIIASSPNNVIKHQVVKKSPIGIEMFFSL